MQLKRSVSYGYIPWSKRSFLASSMAPLSRESESESQSSGSSASASESES